MSLFRVIYILHPTLVTDFPFNENNFYCAYHTQNVKNCSVCYSTCQASWMWEIISLEQGSKFRNYPGLSLLKNRRKKFFLSLALTFLSSHINELGEVISKRALWDSAKWGRWQAHCYFERRESKMKRIFVLKRKQKLSFIYF